MEVIYAWVDDLVHALVHVILGKVTSKMLTSYLKIGPISWMDHKSCSDLCDLRLGEKLTKLYGPKVVGDPTFGIRTPIWESQDKMPFGCEPRGKTHSIL